jgi:hypothetical protein
MPFISKNIPETRIYLSLLVESTNLSLIDKANNSFWSGTETESSLWNCV